MKKVFAISMCIFILLQNGILTFQYVLKLSHHKRLVENQLAAGLLNAQLISFTASELSGAKWENDHEFFLADQKYDIVKVIAANGHIVYNCINDKIEKQLINGLDKSEKRSDRIEELLKKINFQIVKFSDPEHSGSYTEKAPYSVFISSVYAYCFSRVINKPPIC